jgi:hypothetical protein
VTPLVSPSMVQDNAVVVHAPPPGDAVTVYWVTGDPFGSALDQATVTVPSPPTAVGAAGVRGTPEGTRALEGSDSGEAPATFVALTVKV